MVWPRSNKSRALTLLACMAIAVAALPSAFYPASTAAAGQSSPRVVGLSIAQASVVRAASSVRVSFNVPMDVSSVRFAATLVRAQGNSAGWNVIAPVSAGSANGGRTVLLRFAPAGAQLRAGAYSLVVGPAATAAAGAVMGSASVTDFVVAPNSSPWEEVTASGKLYRVWVDASGGPGPVRDDEYLLRNGGGTVLSGGQHVYVVWATDAQGSVVTNRGLASQLASYAEEEGWLRLQQPASVPGALALDPNSVAWVTANGPNSGLGNYLYALAKSLGEDVASPPSQSEVDGAEVASALAHSGPPGTWASELASDLAVLDLARTGSKGYVLAQQLTTLLTEGTLSLPGAEAAKGVLDVLKAVGGAAGFGTSTLQELYTAEWEAEKAAAEAIPLHAISAALPAADGFLASDISGLLHFSLAGEQLAIASAAAKYASGQAYDLSAELARELAAESDPIAAAVVAGLDLGFFIASFTGWDQLRAAFYQAVEQVRAERALADGAQALETSIAATRAPSSATIDGAALAWRLARNTMADFYAQCVSIVKLDQWGQAVDSAFPGLEALVGVHPAQDNLAAWRSASSFDRQQASGLVPGLPQTSGDAGLLAVGTHFPSPPAGVVPVSLCDSVLLEPGRYVVSVPSLVAPDGGDCAGIHVGLAVKAPGVSLDLNGHNVVSSIVGIKLDPAAAGGVVSDGTLTQGNQCCYGFGLIDLAPGILATHLQVVDNATGLLVEHTAGGRFVDNDVTGFSGGFGGIGSNAQAGVSLDDAADVAVDHNVLRSYLDASVGVSLVSSSASTVAGNSVEAGTNAVYAGCEGAIIAPAAHPLARTTCAPSVGNEIADNTLTTFSGAGAGPAVALDSSTAHNLVSRNGIDWPSYTANFYLWDFNRCGVNIWSHNVVRPNPVAFHSHLSNWACVR